MRAVLISVRPKWVSLIEHGDKIIEVRKTRPGIRTPFKVYIYETRGKTDTPWADEDGHLIFKGRGKVIGEFTCDRIYQYTTCSVKDGTDISDELMEKFSCLSRRELQRYENAGAWKEGQVWRYGLYGWAISRLVLYDRPRDLSEYHKECLNDLYCESCAMYNARHDRCGNAALQIRHAPMSWCYVTEKEVPIG